MKDAKSSLSLAPIARAISGYIKRFHVMIYTLTVMIGVSAAMLMLNGLISAQPETPEPGAGASTQIFDQETIDRINSFNTSDSEGDTFELPPGRINPLAN